MLQYLLTTKSTDIIAGDSNYDLLQVSENMFLDYFYRPFPDRKEAKTYISIVDRLCLYQTNFAIEFSIITITENIYFSNHDAIRTLIEKNNVDFHTAP